MNNNLIIKYKTHIINTYWTDTIIRRYAYVTSMFFFSRLLYKAEHISTTVTDISQIMPDKAEPNHMNTIGCLFTKGW